MAEPNIGQEAASVWESVIPPKAPTDNIFNSRALFYSLAGGGIRGLKQGEGFAGRESSGGGRVFEFSIEYAVNTNFHSYGQFASLDLDWIPVFDAARFDIKTAAGTVNWTDLEIAKCQEPSAKYDILVEKLENGKDSHTNDMNQQLLSVAAASSDNIVGIQTIISTTPGAPGDVVGGIDANLWPFWRNKQTSGAASVSPFDNLRPAMRSIYNQCSRGGLLEAPTAILFRRQEFEGYESTLIPQERFTVENKARDGQGAFMNDILKFKGAECFYDEDLNVANAYFYNPKWLKIVYLRNYWMRMSDRLEPVNNLTWTQKIRTHWAFCTNQRRRLGVVSAIS